MNGEPSIGERDIDPSSLTTAQLLREVGSLKELVMAQIESIKTSIIVAHDDMVRVPTEVQKQVGNLKELIEDRLDRANKENALVRTIIETRLDGMDKAIELLQSGADKFPRLVDEKITALERLHEEKFASIQKQFEERDTRTEQSSKDSKVAVDAALQAQKESAVAQNQSNAASITKSEAGFIKQIDQLTVLIQTMTKAFDDKINDLKDRFNRGEGRGEGVKETKTVQLESNKFLIGVLGLLLAVLAFIVGRGGIH